MRPEVSISQDGLTVAWNACRTSREAFQVLQRAHPGLQALGEADDRIAGSVIGLVEGIRHLQAELLRPSRALRIVFAGAGPFEMVMDAHYGPVLHALLGIPSVEIHYVALNADESANVVIGQMSAQATDRIYPMLLSQYAKLVEKSPDLVCLFHPGMRREWEMWLPDSGLRSYVRRGIPVISASWSPAEARIDGRYLEAVGYQLSSDVRNPLAPLIPNADSEMACGVLRRIDGFDKEPRCAPALQVLQFEVDTQDVAEASLDDATRKDLDAFINGTQSGSYEVRQGLRGRFIGMLNRMHWPDYATRRWMRVVAGRPAASSAYHHEYIRVALMLGKPEWAIRYLDAHPEAPEACNGWGETPVMLAAMFNQRELLEALLAKGASIDTIADYGYTALEMAILGGYEEMALALLERGAAMNHDGQTMGVVRALEKAATPMPRLNVALGRSAH